MKPVTWTPTAQDALDRIRTKLFATTTEAAAVLNYDRRTVLKGIESGEIPSVRVGSCYRVPTTWLLEHAGLTATAGHAGTAA